MKSSTMTVIFTTVKMVRNCQFIIQTARELRRKKKQWNLKSGTYMVNSSWMQEDGQTGPMEKPQNVSCKS